MADKQRSARTKRRWALNVAKRLTEADSRGPVAKKRKGSTVESGIASSGSNSEESDTDEVLGKRSSPVSTSEPEVSESTVSCGEEVQFTAESSAEGSLVEGNIATERSPIESSEEGSPSVTSDHDLSDVSFELSSLSGDSDSSDSQLQDQDSASDDSISFSLSSSASSSVPDVQLRSEPLFPGSSISSDAFAAVLAIFSRRHNLTYSCLNDLMCLLAGTMPSPNTVPRSSYSLINKFINYKGECTIERFCGQCLQRLSETVAQCTSSECRRLKCPDAVLIHLPLIKQLQAKFQGNN